MDSILSFLKSGEPKKRRQGVLLLACNPVSANVLLLNNIAEYDESLALRLFAGQVLRALENTYPPGSDADTVSLINRYLSFNSDEEKMHFISGAVSRMRQNSCTFLTLIAAYEKRAGVLCHIISSLAAAGGEAAIKSIVSFNNDRRGEIRRSVFDALACLDNMKAYPYLIQFIIDDDLEIAGSAVNFLTSLNRPLAVKILKFMCSVNKEFMNAAAAKAIGELAEDCLFDDLKKLMSGESRIVKSYAVNAYYIYLEKGCAAAADYFREAASIISGMDETLFSLKAFIEFENYRANAAETANDVAAERPEEHSPPGGDIANDITVRSADGGEDVKTGNKNVNANADITAKIETPAEKIVETPPAAASVGKPAEKPAENETGVILFPLEHNFKFGYIDSNAKLVIPFSFERAYPFTDGLAAVMNGISWGYINASGDFSISAQFEAAYNFSDGLARVYIGQNYGFINQNGHLAIKAQYEDAKDFSEGLAAVKRDGKWNYINAEGKPQFKSIDFERVSSFKNGFAHVRKNKKFGFINAKGELAIKCDYDGAEDFSEGLACVKISSKYGYIDSKDRFVIKPHFDKAREFCGGLAAVEIDKKYGFVNVNGEMAIEAQFEYAASFSEGLAAVKINDLWGFINEKGDLVIEAKFNEAFQFVNGLCYVKAGETFNYINKKGELLYKEEHGQKSQDSQRPHKEINRSISIPTNTVHALMQKHGYPFNKWKSGISGHQPPPKSVEFYFLKASSGLTKSFSYTEIMDLIDAIRRERLPDIVNELMKFLETNYCS